MSKPKQVDIVIFEYQGRYRMNIEVDDKRVPDERITRDYDSPGDAITSARHAVNAYLKEAGK